MLPSILNKTKPDLKQKVVSKRHKNLAVEILPGKAVKVCRVFNVEINRLFDWQYLIVIGTTH